MKIMRVLFCLFLIVFGLCGSAFGQKPFQSTLYGYQPYYYDQGILALKNGSFLTIEAIDVSGADKRIISKFDACQNRQWCKEIKYNANAYENSIIASSDNGFFFESNSSNDNNRWPVITKLDEDGNILWCKKLFLDLPFTAIWYNGGTNLLATSTGGCIISGIAQKLTPAGSEIFIVLTKLDNNGNIVWSKKYEQPPANSFLVEIVSMPNDGFCLLLRVGVAGNEYPYLMNIDKNGELVWLKKINRPLTFISHDFDIKTAGSDAFGNIYAVGEFISQSINDDITFILKIDKAGQPAWLAYSESEYSGTHRGIIGLTLNKEGNIIFNGSQYKNKIEYIGAVSPDAKLLWVRKDLNKNYINSSGSQGNIIQTTDDSGYISITNNNFYFSKINKYDKDGKIGCNQKDTTLDFKITTATATNLWLYNSSCYKIKDTVVLIKDFTKQKVKMICDPNNLYPIAGIRPDTILCAGSSYTLRAGIDNLNKNFKFSWSTGSTDSVITVTKSGKYWLSISSGYCTNTDTVNIVFRDEIKSNLQDKFICTYDSVLVQSPKVNAANFYWIKPDKSIFKQSYIWAKDTGTYNLMLEGNGNCLNIDTFRLQYHPLPKASAGPDTMLCYNQIYEMQGKGGITYKWIPAKYLSNDTIANPLAKAPEQQLYMLIVKNAFGCADTSQMWLKVKPKLEVKLQAVTNSVCSGEAVQLQAKASGGDSLHYTYKWQNTSTTKDSTFNTTLQTSDWLKVTLEDGCSEAASDSIFITVKPTPIAAFYTDPKDTSVAENKIQFINQSQHTTNYEWRFGTGTESKLQNPTYIYTNTGKYFITLIAKNANGCSDTAYGQIYISEEFRIFIPNTFTPDDDFNNDVFSVYGTGIKEYNYEIYNRWGERIFTSNNTNKQSWNGAVENRGEVVQMDVYFYVLKVKDVENRMHYFNGTINLLR
jgi:gliding motility-associated-like protein